MMFCQGTFKPIFFLTGWRLFHSFPANFFLYSSEFASYFNFCVSSRCWVSILFAFPPFFLNSEDDYRFGRRLVSNAGSPFPRLVPEIPPCTPVFFFELGFGLSYPVV